MNRRQLVSSAGALAAAAAVGRVLPAAAAGTVDRRFLFVFAHGGWDTTRVFSAEFDNPAVDMEPDAAPWSIGDLGLVDGPGRPSVRAFFEARHRDVAVIDGLLVPSVAHETCAQIVMTGGTRGAPDWAAMLAGLEASRYVLPNLVVDCPSFPAQYGMAVARAGASGQLDGLVDGGLLAVGRGLRGVPLPSVDAAGAVDRYLQRRAAAAVAGARTDGERAALEAFREANARAIELEDARVATTFGAQGGFLGKLGVAVEALSTGLSRCVSVSHPNPYYSWDTHSDNDGQQQVLWEDLFAGLLALDGLLHAAPSPSGGASLADDVVVVVVSEMGRTPQLNGEGGKDHWPYTSALLFGAGIAGNRQVGGFDQGFRGRPIDLASGAIRAQGVVPTAGHLGATLLVLGGHDPAEHVPGYDPVAALVG